MLCNAALKIGEFGQAEQHVRDNKVGKELASKEFSGEQTLGKAVRRAANRFFFHSGAMTAVLPFMLLLGVAQFGGGTALAHTRRVTLAAVNVVTFATVLIFASFHIWVDSTRVDQCMLVSGHWMT